MADAGESDVSAGHQISALYRLFERQIARHDGGLLVDIELDRHVRLIELEDITMGDIAPEDDFLAVAFQNNSAVAGCVAGVKDRAKTGDRCGIIAESLEFTGIDIGLDAFLRFGITLLQRFRGRLGLCLVKPEVGFTRIDPERRIGKDTLAIRGQPAGMVRVDMGEDNVVYLVGFVTGGLDIGDEPAKARPR